MKNLIYVLSILTVIYFTSCEETSEETTGSLTFQFDAQNSSSNQKSFSEEAEPAFLLVSVKDESGEYQFNLQKIELFKVGDDYIVENLTLPVGSYSLDDFIVLDEEENSIYITPKSGSEFEDLVSTPLPLSFEISAGVATELNVEVIPMDYGSAEDYGYLTLSFTIIDTLEEGLEAYYPFNGNANDESGNNYDGSTSNVTLDVDRNGNTNSAYQFGSDSFIGLGDILDEYTAGADKEFAFSVWIKPTALNTDYGAVLCKNSDSECSENGRQYLLLVNDSTVQFMYQTSLSTPLNNRKATASYDFIKDAWYHIAVNYDGSVDTNDGIDRVEIYVNGVKISSLASISPRGGNYDITDGTAHLGIGNRLDSQGDICGDLSFDGSIDEVRFYSRQLTDLEVITLYEID